MRFGIKQQWAAAHGPYGCSHPDAACYVGAARRPCPAINWSFYAPVALALSVQTVAYKQCGFLIVAMPVTSRVGDPMPVRWCTWSWRWTHQKCIIYLTQSTTGAVTILLRSAKGCVCHKYSHVNGMVVANIIDRDSQQGNVLDAIPPWRNWP